MPISGISVTSVNESGLPTSITVTRTGTGNETYTWAVANGTTSAADFLGATSGSIAFPNGTNSVVIQLTGKADLTAEGAETFSLNFTRVAGPGTNASFNLTMNDTSTCFLAGTLIRTPRGAVPVEALAIGDTILTADGREVAVRWASRQTISRIFSNPARAEPVRIAAGVFGKNLPVRDLVVSPGHAVLVDGYLVRAGALVNGTSVTVVKDMPATFVYYNLECDDHELIVAEGVACESLLNEVPLELFDNHAEYPKRADGQVCKVLGHPVINTPAQMPFALADRFGISQRRSRAA